MPNGMITKGIGGFYYIKHDDKIIECKVRGKFRKSDMVPIIGDNVVFEYTSETHGVITEICERKNSMIRPPVANVDQVVIVFAVTHPEPNFLFIDKMIAVLENKNIETVICINKIDLDENNNHINISEMYGEIGYKVLDISVKDKVGIDKVREMLKGKVSALAGSSGVGKSSLLNELHSDAFAETGELSQKLDRGKHTTRHVELFELTDGGFILDTPGFSMLEVSDIQQNELKYYFREFEELNFKCKFSTCSHINEPGCAVKQAVEDNSIYKSRYESYKLIYSELKGNNQYK